MDLQQIEARHAQNRREASIWSGPRAAELFRGDERESGVLCRWCSINPNQSSGRKILASIA